MKAHIIDGHALLTVADVVRLESFDEVFDALNKLVMHDGSLLVVRQVIDVLHRRAPNSHVSVWTKAITDGRHDYPVRHDWSVKAQAAAQAAGYDNGLEDTVTRQPTGAAEIVGVALFRRDSGLEVAVVTEDWTDKPHRPGLGLVCERLGLPTCRLAEFLTGCGLGHCLQV